MISIQPHLQQNMSRRFYNVHLPGVSSEPYVVATNRRSDAVKQALKTALPKNGRTYDGYANVSHYTAAGEPRDSRYHYSAVPETVQFHRNGPSFEARRYSIRNTAPQSRRGFLSASDDFQQADEEDAGDADANPEPPPPLSKIARCVGNILAAVSENNLELADVGADILRFQVKNENDRQELVLIYEALDEDDQESVAPYVQGLV
jgi:hypothetical protein